MDKGVWQVEVYSDRELKYDRVWKIGLDLDEARFYFVFNGEELVSYGCELPDRFYLKHIGKEVKGRVVKGKKFSLRRRGSELEIKFKGDEFRLAFDYIPFGIRLTPYIHVKTLKWECLVLPELGKVYKSWSVFVESMGGMLLVRERMRRRTVWEDIVRVYALTPTGEYAVYEGKFVDYDALYRPKFFKVGSGVIVELRDVDEKLKECFIRSSDLSYLFVHFFYKHITDRYAKFSFDLENWIEVKAEKMVFKQENELQHEYGGVSSDLDEVLLNCFEKTFERRAPELYKAFTRKIPSALKELSAYIAELDLASSQDLHL